MKQQQSIAEKRFSSGSTEIDTGDPTPSLSQLISRSFLSAPHNKLIFCSQCISMIKPIVLSYLEEFPHSHSPSNLQLLLIDFSELEVDFMGEALKAAAMRQPRRKLFEPDVAGLLDIVRMNSQPIEKRKVLYMKAGVLALSSQVFLTDLLRGWSQGSGLRIKIIIKMGEKVLSHYHYQAWLTTILTINQARNTNKEREKDNVLSLIFLCNRPSYYSEENELIRIYRTFFCKKVVIWPFGRAEIHKALTAYRQKNEVKEWEHTLSMSQGERKLHETFMELYYFLKKRLANKFTQKPGGEHILYSNAIEQGYQFTKGEFTEFQHIKLLLIHLESSSKLTLLNLITKFIETKECQVWNSNNSEAITIIQSLLGQLEDSVFHFEKRENPNNVQLIRLFAQSENVDIEIDKTKESQYICTYPVIFSLICKPETSQKISETIKIIQSIQPNRSEQQQISEKPMDEESRRFVEEINKKSKAELEEHHNVLIMCSLKSVQRFIKDSLEGYITDKSYLQYLRNLHRYLENTRYFRLRKIKKIYDRRKIKKTEMGEGSKKNGDKHGLGEQNKQILKEMFYHELEQLNKIINNLFINLGIISSGVQGVMNTQDTFQMNRDESKIIESFNEDLLREAFDIIDITKIKATYIRTNLENFIFESHNLKKKVFIDHQHRNIEPNYFHQLLSTCNPSTIIFYAPTPLLLRSLYLFQLQNPIQNLHQIHILSFENSYETKKASFEVTKEDKAFWNLSQNRSKLPEFIESPFLRVRSINFRDSIETAKHNLNSKNLFNSAENEGEKSIGEILGIGHVKRKVLVDTREFKSSLPSYLYHFGFEVIPVFLKTADYVLSDDTAIEKKSVHTRDFHNSIKNFRLDEQLKKMSSKFKHPYLLIECEEESDFVKSNFGFLDGTSGNKSRYQIRKRIIQLIHKFPNVRLLWSSSVEQSCEYIKQLKEDKLDPDLSKFIKQQKEELEDEGEVVLPRISQASSQRQDEEK